MCHLPSEFLHSEGLVGGSKPNSILILLLILLLDLLIASECHDLLGTVGVLIIRIVGLFLLTDLG
jgi:hypothetical protein